MATSAHNRDLTTANGILLALEHVLRDESLALDAMDIAAIDRAAVAKEQIAAAWEDWQRQNTGSPLDPEEHERVAQSRARVVALARQNHIRLRASLEAVRGILDAATGTTQTTYGRRSVAPVRPVFTSSVG